MKVIHGLSDTIPFINNNPHKLSVRLRALTTLLNLQNYLYRFFRINRVKWRGPYYNWIFIAYFDLILNYGISTGVPTPFSTNITKQMLNKNTIQPFVDKLQKMDTTHDIIGYNGDAYDYNKFYPRNVNLLWITGNDDIQNRNTNKLIIYIHGGGYALSGPGHIGYCSRLSLRTNTKVLFVDYSKPPAPNIDIPYQVDQVLTTYFYVIDKLQISCNKVVIAGDSAGAGLCSLMLQKLSLLGLTEYHPIGTLLYSPFVDLTLRGNSWKKFANQDMIITEGLASRSGLLATGCNRSLLRSPFFSAVCQQIMNIKSNVMLFVSTTECLYDDSKLLLEKLKPISNQYEIIYKEVAHVPHAFVVLVGVIPEADEAMNIIVKNVSKWFHENKNKIIVQS